MNDSFKEKIKLIVEEIEGGTEKAEESAFSGNIAYKILMELIYNKVQEKFADYETAFKGDMIYCLIDLDQFKFDGKIKVDPATGKVSCLFGYLKSEDDKKDNEEEEAIFKNDSVEIKSLEDLAQIDKLLDAASAEILKRRK